MRESVMVETAVVGLDGKLRLPMERVHQYSRQHIGRRVIVRFEAVIPGSSKALQGYYYNYIVPTLCTAMAERGTRLNYDSTDRWFVGWYPGRKEYCGKVAETGREFVQDAMIDYIEWLKEIASEYLDVYIEDPNIV